MSKRLNTQWHPAFVSAMKLELIEDDAYLKPVKLFHWFEKNGYQIQEVFKGIYYIIRENRFLTQVIVSKQLSKENQKWLTLLSRDFDETEVERAVLQMETLTEESEKRNGDFVLQVVMKENEKLFRQLKEEGKEMCEALRELFEPEMKEAVKNSKINLIRNALNLGSSAEDISRVMGIPLVEVETIAKESN